MFLMSEVPRCRTVPGGVESEGRAGPSSAPHNPGCRATRASRHSQGPLLAIWTHLFLCWTHMAACWTHMAACWTHLAACLTRCQVCPIRNRELFSRWIDSCTASPRLPSPPSFARFSRSVLNTPSSRAEPSQLRVGHTWQCVQHAVKCVQHVAG